MNEKQSTFSTYFIVGVALFALFFGAGNLIFPAILGQNAGNQFWPAVGGFLITGIGLPLLGIMAMGFSGSRNLQELASRVHPIFAVAFTAILYLTIGPFFATPRTGAVAFEIGVAPIIGDFPEGVGLFLFTIAFFAVTLWLSLKPAKMVDIIGKFLSPVIIILLCLLLGVVILNPIGSFQQPLGNYNEQPFMEGFMEGYNTMDALSSLVFGIIIINAIQGLGVTSKRGLLSTTIKSGLIAVSFLGIIYIGIAYLGATTTGEFGVFKTGGPILSNATSHYFGKPGALMLSVIIILACLTTSIGLITSCGQYFQTLFPAIGYKTFVIFFSIISFIIANFGLANIIEYSVPVLLFLYPLAIILMVNAFLTPLFKNEKFLYIPAMAVTVFISLMDSIKNFYTLFEVEYPFWLKAILEVFKDYLPLYEQGLGWLVPAIVTILVCWIIDRIK